MRSGEPPERRLFVGDAKTDPRWTHRVVRVVVRGQGRAPRNALVEFDTGELVTVPTYAGGGIGATLRIIRHDAR